MDPNRQHFRHGLLGHSRSAVHCACVSHIAASNIFIQAIYDAPSLRQLAILAAYLAPASVFCFDIASLIGEATSCRL